MNPSHRKRPAFAPPKPWVSFIRPAAVCLENAIDLCWFVSAWNKAVETQVACIDVSFFISYQCPFHRYPLLADPLLACPHRWKRWFPSCLSCPLPDQQGVWACVYMRLCTTVKFHSVLAKWGLAFSLPVRGGFHLLENVTAGQNSFTLPVSERETEMRRVTQRVG